MSKRYSCVILCGGKSQRMKFELPYTHKFLATFEERPILHHILNYNTSFNLFDQIILCLGNDGSSIEQSITQAPEYIDSKWNGVEIHFLDTGENATATHRLYQASKLIEDDFIMVNYADVITDIDLRELINHHIHNDSDLTLSLVKAQMPYGKALIDDNFMIHEFVEKPILEDWINAGYFILKKCYLDSNTSKNMELEHEFFPFLLHNKVKIYGFKHTKYWKSIDTYKDLVSLRNDSEIKSIIKKPK